MRRFLTPLHAIPESSRIWGEGCVSEGAWLGGLGEGSMIWECLIVAGAPGGQVRVVHIYLGNRKVLSQISKYLTHLSTKILQYRPEEHSTSSTNSEPLHTRVSPHLSYNPGYGEVNTCPLGFSPSCSEKWDCLSSQLSCSGRRVCLSGHTLAIDGSMLVSLQGTGE